MDGSFPLALDELAEARFDGLTAEGWPRVAWEGGGTEEARSLVPLSSADLGVLLAVARLGGRPLIVGRVLPPAPVAVADGVTVIEARERLELRCGAASILLTADGRVELRGAYLLSKSEGANRVQGATVLLN